MIELKPSSYDKSECPRCNNIEPKLNRIFFQGIRVLADYYCQCCKLEYYQDLPIGHALNFPFIIERETKKIHGEKKYKWFVESLSYAFTSEPVLVKIEKKILKDGYKEAIILDCLDYLYGHVLLKLFNAGFYIDKYQEKGVVLILPKSFEWLVPAGVSEVWLVNVKLGQSKREMRGLDEFVQNEIERFEKVYLSPVYSHPDLKDVTIENYTKVKPFQIEDFSLKDPVITFIYREDRLWHSGTVEYFMFLIIRKLKLLSYFKYLYPGIQNRRIVSFFKNVKRQLPGVKCHVAGLGSYGKFPVFIFDDRKTIITEEIEKKWCELYSQSHLVVGVHGSNMLLPSAHAAGFVEILPQDRIGNITQDLFCKYDSRNMLFLGRFVDGYISPKHMSHHVLKMIKGWKVFNIYSRKEKLVYHELKDLSDYKVNM